VTQFTATLNGSLDPDGSPAAYHFLYGTSTAYGSIAPVPDLVLNTAETPTTLAPQSITGLLPGTTYHYTLLASGPGGSTIAPDQTFTTPSIPPPIAATGSAIATCETAATR
jgi:hypothetical protein